MTSLNPVHTMGQQIVEAIIAHTTIVSEGRQSARGRMLDLCGFPLARSASTTIRTICPAACASAP